MKNRVLSGIIYIIGGLLLIFGPISIFKVCSTKEMIMKCHWSVQAEIGIGIIAVAAGIITLFSWVFEARLAVNILSLVAFIIAILIPSVLIGGCEDKRMACQSLTFPSNYLVSGIVILYILLDSIFLIRKRK